jgi:hypothetical protein
MALALILMPAVFDVLRPPATTRFPYMIIDRVPQDPGRRYSRIRVLGDGSILLQRHLLPDEQWRRTSTPEEVVTFASTLVAGNPNQRFVLVFDQVTPWRSVDWVLDALHQSKAKSLCFCGINDDIDTIESPGYWLTRHRR